MSESIGEAFVLLEGYGPEPLENRLKTRVLDLGAGGPFRIGVDPSGGRHFLIPLQRGEEFRDDHRGRNLALVSRTLSDGAGSEMRFADITCMNPDLSDVFEQFLEDLADRIRQSPSVPLSVIGGAIADWRELFTRGMARLMPEEERGLLAELIVLEKLARVDPARALSGWQGPKGASWDFRNASRAIEVKATYAVDPTSVRISNIEQLDPAGLDELILAVVHLRDDPGGLTVSKMVSKLVGRGVERHQLMEDLEMAGYVPGASDENGYAQASMRCWVVDAHFPSLRRSDLGVDKVTAISNVKYKLALPTAGLMETDDEISRSFGRWFQ